MIRDLIPSIRVGCALILLGFLVLGPVLWGYHAIMTSCHQNSPLLHTIHVTLEPRQDQRLLEQSRKFASQYDFRVDMGPFVPAGNTTRFRMVRKDFEIIVRSGLEAGLVEIAFYNHDCADPNTAKTHDSWVNALKSFINDVPTLRITYEQ